LKQEKEESAIIKFNKDFEVKIRDGSSGSRLNTSSQFSLTKMLKNATISS